MHENKFKIIFELYVYCNLRIPAWNTIRDGIVTGIGFSKSFALYNKSKTKKTLGRGAEIKNDFRLLTKFKFHNFNEIKDTGIKCLYINFGWELKIQLSLTYLVFE